MIQYGCGADIVPGDPDVVQAQREQAARDVEAAAAKASSTGLLVLLAAGAAWFFFARKRKAT